MRWLLAPVTAAVFAGGVWVAGGVITDRYTVAMGLTAAWFALFGAACVLLAWRRRGVAVPVLSGFVVAALIVGGYLGLTTLRDKVVHEAVAVAGSDGDTRTASGAFRSVEHESAGRATIVRRADGRQVLTLTKFSTSAGPDLRVRLVPGDSEDGGGAGNVDLGALKGNIGDQQYELQADFDPSSPASVVIWCRAFSVAFAAARVSDAVFHSGRSPSRSRRSDRHRGSAPGRGLRARSSRAVGPSTSPAGGRRGA